MRPQRLGWPATVAVATLLGIALWRFAPALGVATYAIAATGGALVVSWGLDIGLSVLGDYRTGTQQRSFGAVVRRHTALRTPSSAALVRTTLIGVAALAVVSATLGTGIAGVDRVTPTVGVELPDGAAGADTAASDGLNETAIERAIHDRINEVRAERGLRRLAAADRLSTSAREHSGRMADRGELDHSDLDTQYACGYAGENIAYTYARGEVTTESGTVNYHGNETAIGHGLVRQWMQSVQHRQNILDPRFTGEGIGVATSETADGQRVYATQALCG